MISHIRKSKVPEALSKDGPALITLTKRRSKAFFLDVPVHPFGRALIRPPLRYPRGKKMFLRRRLTFFASYTERCRVAAFFVGRRGNKERSRRWKAEMPTDHAHKPAAKHLLRLGHRRRFSSIDISRERERRVLFSVRSKRKLRPFVSTRPFSDRRI